MKTNKLISNTLKIIFYLITCSIVISCSDIKPSSIKKNKEGGVVVIKFDEFTFKSSVFFRKGTNFKIDVMKFCNVSTGKCFKLKQSKDSKYKTAIIDEGEYYLLYYLGKYNKKLAMPSVAGFKIKKGEIIYLGDVENMHYRGFFFRPYKRDITFYLKDNLEDAKKYVKQEYTFIDADKMQTRLLTKGYEAKFVILKDEDEKDK